MFFGSCLSITKKSTQKVQFKVATVVTVVTGTYPIKL